MDTEGALFLLVDFFTNIVQNEYYIVNLVGNMIMMKTNQKSAFSLIELLQTVVLLGIIAGLSISFFKNIKSDTKLRDSTEIMLMQAIQEANKQMCADDTPYCTGFRGATRISYIVNNDNNMCSSTFAGSAYNNKGYCTLTKPPAGCPAGMEEYTETNGTITCFAPPKCYQSNNLAAPLQILKADGTVVDVSSVPLHEAICATNAAEGGRAEPQWNAKVPRTIDGNNVNAQGAEAATQVNEICYRLWDLINHKRQGATKFADLVATCVTNTNSCFANSAGVSCNGVNNDTTNMILPNGTRLYNLSALGFTDRPAGANHDGQHIFIKYDKNPNIGTYSDSTVLPFNAVRLGGANNLECNTAFITTTAGAFQAAENAGFNIPEILTGFVQNYVCQNLPVAAAADGPVIGPTGWGNLVNIPYACQHDYHSIGWINDCLGGAGDENKVNENCWNKADGTQTCAHCTRITGNLTCKYGGYTCGQYGDTFECSINGGEVSDIRYNKDGNVDWVRCNSWNASCTDSSIQSRAISECKTALCSYNYTTNKWETGGSEIDKYFLNEFVKRWKTKQSGSS